MRIKNEKMINEELENHMSCKTSMGLDFENNRNIYQSTQSYIKPSPKSRNDLYKQ